MIRFFALLGALLPGAAMAQQAGPVLSRVESGLEEAVGWKWTVEPGTARRLSAAGPEEPAASATPVAGQEGTYVVKKGDALVKIARRHGITVEQLKLANDLKGDLIRVGDVLRIPAPEEVARMPVAPVPAARQGGAPAPLVADFDPEVLLLQVYLDRLGFSPGPIDGKPGLRFQKLMFTYQSAHPEGSNYERLLEAAAREVGDPFATYVLKPEDLAWIRPPAAPSRSSKKLTPEERAAQAYRELVSAPELLYRSAFEFVAERFHCEEGFLRDLNPTLKPQAGSVFRVPNVVPFEIEHDLEGPLRPPADPERPVHAVIADLARLEIYQNEQMVASFPISVARPGLRGRGEWIILDSVTLPQLSTLREPRAPRTPPVGDGGAARPATLAKPEVLGPGPRNPVGVLWINLAKAEDRVPLPFGLHGTSIPNRMFVTESLGGFRMANWDIVRAARLLPVGTPLRWRQTVARPQTARPAVTPVPMPATPAPIPEAQDGTVVASGEEALP